MGPPLFATYHNIKVQVFCSRAGAFDRRWFSSYMDGRSFLWFPPPFSLLFPFEPLASLSLPLLPMKVAFLGAITSSHRVRELAVLWADPFLKFHDKKVVLLSGSDIVVTWFHVLQNIMLSLLFLHQCLRQKSLLPLIRSLEEDTQDLVPSECFSQFTVVADCFLCLDQYVNQSFFTTRCISAFSLTWEGLCEEGQLFKALIGAWIEQFPKVLFFCYRFWLPLGHFSPGLQKNPFILTYQIPDSQQY